MVLWGARWKEAGARYLPGAGRARAPVRCHDVSVGQRLVRVSLLGPGSPGQGSVWLPRDNPHTIERRVQKCFKRARMSSPVRAREVRVEG